MLKRVSIQNFKSLKDVTLDLQKVNLLIGPNNSGKTNFLKAIQYMLKENVNQQEVNYERINFSNNRENPVVIEFEFNKSHPSNSFTPIYICEISQSGQIKRIRGSAYETHADLRAMLGQGIIYKPDTNKLDKPGPVGRGDDFVTSDASNLIAFFDRIRDEYPKSFSQIKTDLVKCIPEFTEINFQNVKSTKELVDEFGDKTFKRIGLTDVHQNRIYWADELSEGTLYFIALLCIINQPNPPKLLLLEEPEKGIHPWRMKQIMDFIRRLVIEKDTQVIMTTHSPVLLDEFAQSLNSVFVFDKDEEGITHVRNLLHEVVKPKNEENEKLGIPPIPYTEALGEYWTIGFLGGVPHEAT